MRKFKSEILVKPNGDWLYQNKPILNKEILNYFKKNLLEDKNGVYIKNTFQNLTEMAYIELQGYPLTLTDFSKNHLNFFLICETEEKLNVVDLDFFLDEKEVLFVKKKSQRFLKYKISSHCLMKISDFLTKDKKFKFLEKIFPIYKI